MSSIYYYLCFLCCAAVLGEEAVTQTPAPVETSLEAKAEPPQSSSEPPQHTPLPAVEQAAPVLDADSRAAILGEIEKAKKLEEAAPAKPEEAVTVSTTLENAVTSTSVVEKQPDKETRETNSTKSGFLKPQAEPVCADKVVVKGGESLEPDCMGTFRKSSIKPTKDHAFKTIYRNKKGKHLYYWKPAGNWIIEGEGHYDTSYGALFAHADTRCPESAHEWKIWEDEGWTTRHGITVKEAPKPIEGDANSTDKKEDDDESDDDDDDDEEEPEPKDDAGEIEIVRFDNKVSIDPEPTPGSLMRLPLIAALLSFTGVLAYSLVFLFKIFKRRKSTSKAKSTGRVSEELDFEDLECAYDAATSKKADPPVRKQVRSKVEEVKQVLATALDPDDAGWGDDMGWSDIEDDIPA